MLHKQREAACNTKRNGHFKKQRRDSKSWAQEQYCEHIDNKEGRGSVNWEVLAEIAKFETSVYQEKYKENHGSELITLTGRHKRTDVGHVNCSLVSELSWLSS